MNHKKDLASKNVILQGVLLLLKGMIVGFGAILPGVSGGTLCVAFGMYQPLIELFSHPRSGIRKYWMRLGAFLLGAGIGFIGLSGLAGWLLEQNSQAVTCAFIGFVLGTLPELWKDAGQTGRGRSSYLAMILCFAAMTGLLLLLKSSAAVTIRADIWGFLFCGVMWGLSFVVPGLSSSTLLLFFGLYQPMLDGISKLSLEVLIPLGIGVGACLLILPKGVSAAYRRHHAVISHAILGIVAATTVSIFPSFHTSIPNILLNLACIAGGAVFSYLIGVACSRLSASRKLPE